MCRCLLRLLKGMSDFYSDLITLMCFHVYTMRMFKFRLLLSLDTYYIFPYHYMFSFVVGFILIRKKFKCFLKDLCVILRKTLLKMHTSC